MKLQACLDWLTTQQTPMTDMLLRWCHINSGTFHTDGVQRMAVEITQAFRDVGAEVETISLPPFKQINDQGNWQEQPLGPLLRIYKRPQAAKQVLLCGHMDTVYPANSAFQSCSWIDNHTLNGPGVADMKGGLITMLFALQAFEKNPTAEKLGWEVIINPDEEIGSPGSASIFAQRASHFNIGLLFEPATTPEGALAGPRKGSGKFSIVVHGKAAHVGRAFNEGRNAIVGLAELIHKIDKLNNQRTGVTINVGYCHGGNAVNVVPDSAICHLDIRTTSKEDEMWLEESLKNIITEYNTQHDYHAEYQGTFTRPPKLFDETTTHLYTWAANCAKSLGLNLTWQATGGCCDGNNLAAAGLPNIDTLGVRGGAIHSDKEYIILDSLVERAQLLTLLLYKFAREKACVGRTLSHSS